MILAGIFYPRASEITLAIDPFFLYHQTTTQSGVTTVSATVTPSGGTAPYTYNWVTDSGDESFILSAQSATSATTAFSFSGLYELFDTIFGSVYCTVTDAYGVEDTVYLNITISRTG